jgi:ATP-binding cassette, subfamily B (MDR/TAP), member 1
MWGGKLWRRLMRNRRPEFPNSVRCLTLFPVIFSETVSLLFRQIEPCINEDIAWEQEFDICAEYWGAQADDMRQRSFVLSGYWIVVLVGCLAGHALTFYGFGMASERMNKRIRDMSFTALLRQEVGFFDQRSAGSMTSQLQDDAARIQAFTGDPVRVFVTATSCALTGILLAFIVRGEADLLHTPL